MSKPDLIELTVCEPWAEQAVRQDPRYRQSNILSCFIRDPSDPAFRELQRSLGIIKPDKVNFISTAGRITPAALAEPPIGPELSPLGLNQSNAWRKLFDEVRIKYSKIGINHAVCVGNVKDRFENRSSLTIGITSSEPTVDSVFDLTVRAEGGYCPEQIPVLGDYVRRLKIETVSLFLENIEKCRCEKKELSEIQRDDYFYQKKLRPLVEEHFPNCDLTLSKLSR